MWRHDGSMTLAGGYGELQQNNTESTHASQLDETSITFGAIWACPWTTRSTHSFRRFGTHSNSQPQHNTLFSPSRQASHDLHALFSSSTAHSTVHHCSVENEAAHSLTTRCEAMRALKRGLPLHEPPHPHSSREVWYCIALWLQLRDTLEQWFSQVLELDCATVRNKGKQLGDAPDCPGALRIHKKPLPIGGAIVTSPTRVCGKGEVRCGIRGWTVCRKRRGTNHNVSETANEPG